MEKDSHNQPRRRPQNNTIDGFIGPSKNNSHPASRSNSFSQTTESAGKIPFMPDKLKPALASPSGQQSGSLLNKTIHARRSSSSPGRQGPTNATNAQQAFHPMKRKKSKWSLKRKITTSLVLIVLAAIAVGGWDAWQLYHKLNHIAVGNLSASVGGAENILVAGSTNRCNLTVQNAQWGFCSQGVTGVNSDIIIIVHIVPKTHTMSLLSIPRDTFVPNARSGNQAFKIDAALYQGPTQLVKAVEQDFGIPVQHYVEVGFDGFVNVVNAVGGVKMEFPMPVYDSDSYLNIRTPGCKVLNGVQALQVVRARHLQYKPATVTTSYQYYWPREPQSDIARIARTHEFLRVLASTVASKGLSDPITDQKLVNALAPQVQVDSGFSTAAMVELMQQFHSVNMSAAPQFTLPISTTTFGSYYYQGYNMGDVVFPSQPSDRQIIDKFLGQSSSINTMTGQPLPKPKSVSVSVLNGSGIPEQATQTSQGLQALGFNISGTAGSATPVSRQAQETVVYYANTSSVGYAEAVAGELSGPVILSQNSSMVSRGANVAVVTGTGLSVNPPSPSASTPSTKSSSTPTSPAASAAATTALTGLEPPSPATQGLSPWDPRACTQ
jgi:LCP family protein required for cell wall assembly